MLQGDMLQGDMLQGGVLKASRVERIAFYCGQLLGCWFMLQAAE